MQQCPNRDTNVSVETPPHPAAYVYLYRGGQAPCRRRATPTPNPCPRLRVFYLKRGEADPRLRYVDRWIQVGLPQEPITQHNHAIRAHVTRVKCASGFPEGDAPPLNLTSRLKSGRWASYPGEAPPPRGDGVVLCCFHRETLSCFATEVNTAPGCLRFFIQGWAIPLLPTCDAGSFPCPRLRIFYLKRGEGGPFACGMSASRYRKHSTLHLT